MPPKKKAAASRKKTSRKKPAKEKAAQPEADETVPGTASGELEAECLVVGVGASAGRTEVFRRFLEALPEHRV